MKGLLAVTVAALLVASFVVPAPRGEQQPGTVLPEIPADVRGLGTVEQDTAAVLRGAPDTSSPAGGLVTDGRTVGIPAVPPAPRNLGSRDRARAQVDPRRAAVTRPSPSLKPHSAPKAVQRVSVATPPRTQSKYGVPWLIRQGLASHMGPRFPAGYLALPHGPGWRARICGAGGCVEMVSNDAGPDLAMQREGRVADLSVQTFAAVCGVPPSAGLCQVSVTILGKAR